MTDHSVDTVPTYADLLRHAVPGTTVRLSFNDSRRAMTEARKLAGALPSDATLHEGWRQVIVATSAPVVWASAERRLTLTISANDVPLRGLGSVLDAATVANKSQTVRWNRPASATSLPTQSLASTTNQTAAS